MTHQRPIPEAAQSPYPLHPRPAPAAVDGDAGKAGDGDTKIVSIDPRSWSRRDQIGLGAAVGIGSAALLAALLYARRGNGTADDRRQAA